MPSGYLALCASRRLCLHIPRVLCRLISTLSPLAIRSPGRLPHPIDVKSYTAMLRCLLWSSCQMSPSVVLSDYDTAEDLREKARHMKREEQEAYKRAEHTRKKRDYNAETAHKRDALRHKRAMEHLNNEVAKVIFRRKNEVSWPIASRRQVCAC
jgi:hypothetical protein